MNCSCNEPQYHMMSVDKYVCGVCNGSPPEAWHASVWAARGVKPADSTPNEECKVTLVSMNDFLGSLPKLDPWQIAEKIERAHAEAVKDLPYKPASALDQQCGGDHYKSKAIQPVEYIHANGLGFIEGSVVKYITRWRDKGGVQDLEKIKHYIDLLIELEARRAGK